MARTTTVPMPPSSAPITSADHDLVARIARVWVLEHRPIGNQRELEQLVDDLQAWQQRTYEVLARRFGPVAESFAMAVGPLVEPDPADPLRSQVSLVRRQAAMRMAWLSDLRESLPDQLTTAPTGGIGRNVPDAGPVVVLTTAPTSATTTAVAGALEALGDGQHAVIPFTADLVEMDHAVPLGSAAIVIVEREARSNHPAIQSVLALGWAVGALGRDRVLAVLAPLAGDHAAFDGLTVVPAKVRARWRAEVVAWAAAATRPDRRAAVR